jgi:hypothetical protein
MAGLPDEALVCRGGACTAARFLAGSGVSAAADGKLSGVSVNCAERKSVAALSRTIPNRRVGVTNVGAIRRLGGDVIAAPSSQNPDHCVMGGLTAAEAETLFTPTQPNPSVS